MTKFSILVLLASCLMILSGVRAEYGDTSHCPEIAKRSGYHLDVFKNTCYLFVDEKTKWDTAKEDCSNIGGELLSIKNMETMNYIKMKLYSRDLGWSNRGVWNGASDLRNRGWEWTTGEKLTFTYWAYGQPSKLLGLISFENCACMRRSDGWKWHDCQCHASGVNYEYICQFHLDECFSKPCLNGGTCIYNAGSNICRCPPGWTGEKCGIDINECLHSPCLFSGTCVNTRGSYECQCAAGRTGKNCKGDVNECFESFDNCQNGGVCSNTIGSYTCQCTAGWTGQSCSEDINECLEGPCLNGGFCKNTYGSYVCDCTPNWMGLRCENDYNECSNLTICDHEGTCLNTEGGFRCKCLPGWTGPTCNTDINECLESPCHKGGSCVNSIGSYKCYCQLNWIGARCEIDYNECSNLTICEHGGTCINMEGGFRCMCPPAWTGPTCNTELSLNVKTDSGMGLSDNSDDTVSANTKGLAVGAVLLLLLLSLALYILYRKREQQKARAGVELQTTCCTITITHQKPANHAHDTEIPSGSAMRAVSNIYADSVEMETRIYNEIQDPDNGSDEVCNATDMMHDEAVSLPLPKLGLKIHA